MISLGASNRTMQKSKDHYANGNDSEMAVASAAAFLLLN
jgi:hypothetical protein